MVNIFTCYGLGLEALNGSDVIVCCKSPSLGRDAFSKVYWYLKEMGRVSKSGRGFIEVSGGGKLIFVNKFESLRGRHVDVVFLGPGTEDRYWWDAAWLAVGVREGLVIRD